MPLTNIPAVTPMTSPAPSRSMPEEEFAPAADTYAAEQVTLSEELADLVPAMNTLAGEIEDIGDAAAASEEAAGESEFQSQLNANYTNDRAIDAENAFLSFDKRYLGVKTADPTLDNQGAALVTGALYYYNGTGDKGMKIRTASATWEFAYLPVLAYALLSGADFTGRLEASAGLRIKAGATLGATEAALFDFISDVVRFYTGNGSGTKKFTFAKRTSSVTTDQISIDDNGKMSFLVNNIIDGLMSIRNTPTALGGGTAFDCALNNYFTKTISGNTTFTVSNVPSSGTEFTFKLTLTHTSGTITWFSGVIWPNGNAPVLTTGKVHEFFFTTQNGGTTWRASVNPNYSS